MPRRAAPLTPPDTAPFIPVVETSPDISGYLDMVYLIDR